MVRPQSSGDVVAKVGGFGMATTVDSYLAKQRQFRWSSPEVAERKSKFLSRVYFFAHVIVLAQSSRRLVISGRTEC